MPIWFRDQIAILNSSNAGTISPPRKAGEHSWLVGFFNSIFSVWPHGISIKRQQTKKPQLPIGRIEVVVASKADFVAGWKPDCKSTGSWRFGQPGKSELLRGSQLAASALVPQG